MPAVGLPLASLDPLRARKVSAALLGTALGLAIAVALASGHVGAARLNGPPVQSASGFGVPQPPSTNPAPVSAPPAEGPTVASGARTRNVVVVSFDGLRPDAIRHSFAPNLEWLRAHGAYSWRALTIRRSYTLPSHASMLSGVDAEDHQLIWNRWWPEKGFIRVPTIFSIARAAGLPTAMFVGKPKFRHIAAPGTVDLYERPSYLCGRVAREAAAYLERTREGVTFVHFSDPDDRGHAAGWMSASQFGAVRAADGCLGQLLAALRRSGRLDSTFVLVSSDHGGHRTNHGGDNDLDRRIPWIAFGPGVRHGWELRSAVSTMDTAATVLYVLGLQPPERIVGRPVREIFDRDDPIPVAWAARLAEPAPPRAQ